jgi:methylated-DNA-protein-cysteine methyltransferase-like protein
LLFYNKLITMHLRRLIRGTSNLVTIMKEHSAIDSSSYHERVYRIVRMIPSGRVMTYGQIAQILGETYTPRTVGYVLHASNSDGIPWHRVINAQGACSTGRIVLPPEKQRGMLEAEGIKFDLRGRCDLSIFRWSPEDAEYTDQQSESDQTSLFEA